MPPAPRDLTPSAWQQTLLSAAAGIWVLGSHWFAVSLASHIPALATWPAAQTLVASALWLAMLLFGLSALSSSSGHAGVRLANLLPSRPSSQSEWLQGFALGWAMVLAAAFPMILVGRLSLQAAFSVRTVESLVIAVVALAVSSLALEVAFHGYLFSRVIAVLGPTSATLLLSLALGALSFTLPNATGLSVAVTFLGGVLLCMARLRTNALYLGWGLHFGWSVIAALLLGMPVSGDASFAQVMFSTTSSPNWLTGGPYGLEASAFAIPVLLLGAFALYRLTRDYAWTYTHEPIIAKGYPVEIAPPAAHVAMEHAATQAAPLVQILPHTPENASTEAVIDKQLRAEAQSDSKSS